MSEISTEAAVAAPTTTADTKPSRRRETGAPKRRVTTRRPSVDVAEFKSFLATLAMSSEPIVHVNGPQHTNCVLAVDFGQPLVRNTKLTSEQSSDFVSRMRKLTREVLGREANVRVSNDGQTGIYWTSVS